ncbi:ZIP family metal transporter [Clostridium sp. 19966]|uniref:ZIP family metal transporter n=1 Tax=Clostridium sp. 19966 TaxID=2768166 RepID=UPI0028DEA27C|nr:ZIP family metal transporter [Clostridium sp. 19966]MDT8715600.1 ZIP family metal transporter [Clostridium sp. 19966]
MNDILTVVVLSSIISLIGTMLGACMGLIIKKPSKTFLSGIMGFAGGLMLSIVVFDLIPESIEKWNFAETVIFSIIGMLIIMLLDSFIQVDNVKINEGIKVATLTALGLMLHNLPEGIIMGFGFLGGKSLGIKLSVIIALHDIPEGMAVSAPLMVSNVKVSKIILYAFITAIPTAIGAWIGIFAGNISQVTLSACLAIASGIMLFVVCGELIPQAIKMSKGKSSTFGMLIGLILGLIMINVL